MNIWKGPDPSSFKRPFCALRAQQNSTLNAFSYHITLFCWASVYMKHCVGPNKTRPYVHNEWWRHIHIKEYKWVNLMKTNRFSSEKCLLLVIYRIYIWIWYVYCSSTIRFSVYCPFNIHSCLLYFPRVELSFINNVY